MVLGAWEVHEMLFFSLALVGLRGISWGKPSPFHADRGVESQRGFSTKTHFLVSPLPHPLVGWGGGVAAPACSARRGLAGNIPRHIPSPGTCQGLVPIISSWGSG